MHVQLKLLLNLFVLVDGQHLMSKIINLLDHLLLSCLGSQLEPKKSQLSVVPLLFVLALTNEKFGEAMVCGVVHPYFELLLSPVTQE